MIDYISKFKSNNEFIQNNKEEEYKNALMEYYSTDNSCPSIESDEVKKEQKDGELIITCKKNKYYMKIKLAKHINLYQELNKKEKNKNIILGKISNILMEDDISKLKDQFIKLKEEYVNNKNEIKSIEEVLEKQNNKLYEHKNILIALINESSIVYYKRKNYYKQIQNYNLDKTQKSSIMNFLKQHSNNINSKTLHHLNKYVKIDEDDLKNWIEWMRKCVKYLMIKYKIRKERRKLKKLEEHFEKINTHFIIDLPVIQKHKEIEVKQKGGGTIFDNPMDQQTQVETPVVQEEQQISVQSEPIVQEQKQTQVETSVQLESEVQEQKQVETPVESVPEVQEQKQVETPVESLPEVQEQKQVESVPTIQEQQIIPSLSNQKQDASSLGLLSKIKKFLPSNLLSQNGGEKKQIFIKTDVPKYNEEKLKETDNIKIIRIKKEHLIPRI